MTLNDCPVPETEIPVDRTQRALVWRLFLAAWAVVAYLIWS